MSYTALQRVMIRLLHDPRLVRAVYQEGAHVLDDVALTDRERGWLLVTPRAAWSTDPERPARVLAALREEFPVSSRTTGRAPADFFSAVAFHDAVQTAGSLAAAFGVWLTEGTPPEAAAFARIEAAIAHVRRAPRRPLPHAADERGLTPTAVVVTAPTGSLDRYQQLRRGAAPSAVGEGSERLLVLRPPQRTDVTIEELPDALAALLSAALPARRRTHLIAMARELGAEPDEAEAIVTGLETDQLLI